MRAQLHGGLDSLEAREAASCGCATARRRPAQDPGRDRRAFKLSRERIRQIERETMAKLRHPSRLRCCADYLD